MPGSKRSLKKKIVKSRIFLPPTLEKTAGSPTLARRRRAVEESITRRFSYMPLLAVWMHFAPFNGPSRGGSRPRIKRIKQSSNQAIKQSNNQTIKQSINQTIRQSNNQTIKQSNNQAIKQSEPHVHQSHRTGDRSGASKFYLTKGKQGKPFTFP